MADLPRVPVLRATLDSTQRLRVGSILFPLL
jgi:hypothetical protein